MNINRTNKVMATAVVAAIAATGTAYAENYFNSSLGTQYEGVYTGKESRDWRDYDRDSASTTVRFDTCRITNYPSSTPTRSNVQVYMNTFPEPDKAMSSTTKQVCYETKSWGDVPSEDYHFTVKTINGASGGARLYATGVRVRW